MMANHVAYMAPNPLPQTTHIPVMIPPNHKNHLIGHASRITSSTLDHELSNRRGWLQNMLSHITSHPQFEPLFPSIDLCLQLEENTWNTYVRLREDPHARSKLEFWHPSIWHSPPEDVWISIVQLRNGSTFSSLQPLLLAEIQEAYIRQRQAKINPRRYSSANDTFLWADNASVATEQSTMHTSTSSTSRAQPDHNAGSMQSNLNGRVNFSMSPSRPAASTASLPSQRPLAKLAPDGMMYRCPSRYCKREFKKQAFYIKHLEQKHPDFGKQASSIFLHCLYILPVTFQLE